MEGTRQLVLHFAHGVLARTHAPGVAGRRGDGRCEGDMEHRHVRVLRIAWRVQAL
jgi:hypothetical protein